jgi:membrane fusion protein, multidrug efflux system
MSETAQPTETSPFVPDAEPLAPEIPVPAQSSRLLPILIGAAVLIVVAAGAVWLLGARRTSALAAEARERTALASHGTVTRTALVAASPAVRSVELLGEARPFASVTLYAKVAGYLKTVAVDVGDRVDAGSTVATIESPETDRALLSAKADFENKQLDASRIAQLLTKKMVSPQEADRARTEAAMASERLEGLREQQGYETLRAPFAGRITARFADPGALVQSAATSQTSALPVVTVSKTDSLRIFIYLDQADAASARRGTPATVALTERPGVKLAATISRVAGELDPKTRKMLAELDLNNRDGAIVPGSFVQVRIDFPSASRPQAPVEALLVRGGKTFVGALDSDARVHLVPVVVAANDGRALTFASGVAVGQRLALSLGSAVADGDRVQVDSAGTGAKR